jgi:lipopolysaccharide assembly outer membrane protein LptD (OstA)
MIEKIVATGDVKIIRDDVVTFGEKAIYSEKNKKITLKGKPRLVIFPDKEGENSLFKGSNKNEDSGS